MQTDLFSVIASPIPRPLIRRWVAQIVCIGNPSANANLGLTFFLVIVFYARLSVSMHYTLWGSYIVTLSPKIFLLRPDPTTHTFELPTLQTPGSPKITKQVLSHPADMATNENESQ